MKKAGDLVKQLVNDFTDSAKYLGVFKEWQSIAGRDIAAHAKIRDIENGFVLVDLDHPGWMQRIQLQQRRIVRKITEKFPELGIKGLKLYLRTIDTRK